MRKETLKLFAILAAVTVVSVLPVSTAKADYKMKEGVDLSITAPKGATSMTSSRNELYVYDANGNVVTKQTPSGYLVDYSYDAAGNEVSTQEHKFDGMPWGMTVKQYDATGKVVSEVDATGAVVYTYTYDGNVVTKTEADFPHDSYIYTYDAKKNLIQYETPDAVHTYTYDANGNVTQIKYTTNYGYTLIKDYTYDAKGNITTEHRYDTDGGDGTSVYTNVYDAAGRLSIVDDGEGNIYQFSY